MSERRVARMVFTPAEWRAFGFHGLVVAGIAVGMWVVAPSRTGQIAGVILAVVLLPVPPVVIYWLRRWKQ